MLPVQAPHLDAGEVPATQALSPPPGLLPEAAGLSHLLAAIPGAWLLSGSSTLTNSRA